MTADACEHLMQSSDPAYHMAPCTLHAVGLMCCPWRRQGIYRRADANVGLGRMRKALTDYKRAAQVNPRDPDLRKKLAQCEKEVKRIRFEEAVATPVRPFILLFLF